ncbi:MAG: hypothetical protein HY718_17615 [Planctomycetes bacterium]|nr:hypothetical protein [Planctomycetota bacterium]
MRSLRTHGRELLAATAAAAILLAAVSPAMAIRVFTPPWGWAGTSVTTQGWEYAGGGASLHEPSYVDNPYGPPQIQWQGASPEFDPNGPGLTGVWTWHVDVDGGGFLISLYNDPEPRPVKYIHLQYTSDKAASGPPSTSPPGSAQAGGAAGHAGTWYTYEWTLTIQPNPPFEQIFVPFPESTNIEEIWVSSICTIPEPAALLLAVGGVWAMRRRPRRA